MFWDIVTNVGNRKKPWEDVPIEVLIEEEQISANACMLRCPCHQKPESRWTHMK